MPDRHAREPTPASEPRTFQQLRLLFIDPIQHDYEVIRTVVLFGERVTARGRGRRRRISGDRIRSPRSVAVNGSPRVAFSRRRRSTASPSSLPTRMLWTWKVSEPACSVSRALLMPAP